MRVIEYRQPARRTKRKKPHGLRALCLLLVLLLITSLGTALWRYSRPVSALEVNVSELKIPSQTIKLAWPGYGQSAAGAVGYGVLAQQGLTDPKPIASITKVATALTVLQEKPLKLGEQGPKITLTKQDMAIYDSYQANDGSVVPIRVGEQLTQYQMLQALLLPSSNNLADTLAIWAFGSLDSFDRAANAYVASLGMSQTTIAGASGFSPKSVSTATDLIKLGEAAMRHPVVRQIVNQTEVPFPVAGKIYNVNGMLGKNGIVGIKPGNTDEAGGCFLGAATVNLPNGKKVTVISAVMNAPNLIQALVDSRKLLASIPQGFDEIEVAPAGAKVGYVNVPWGSPVSLVTRKNLIVSGWMGATYQPKITLSSLQPPYTTDQSVGQIQLDAPSGKVTTEVYLAAAVAAPSAAWRRKNIF